MVDDDKTLVTSGKKPYRAPALRRLTPDSVLQRLVAELGEQEAIRVLSVALCERDSGKKF